MNTSFSCSILVSTYNWPQALELCLRSLFVQRVLPHEIIVCDDGSTAETRQLIDRLRPQSPVPLRHLWHPDEGFQLARIRNKGLASATGDYVIQIDGDLVLHPHFIKDHIALAQPGWFTSGNRFDMSPATTERLFQTGQYRVGYQWRWSPVMWRQWRIPALQNLFAQVYHWKTEYEYVSGCNMAFWRNDLLAINGYDESFTGWGWEDTDVAIRLMNLGVRMQFLRLGGIQYHLYHPQSSRLNELTNRERALRAFASKQIHCEQGVSQYERPFSK